MSTILLVALDTTFMLFRLRREAAPSLPRRVAQGRHVYAVLRSLQMRWLRLPKRQVKMGQRLPDRY